jgi:hypothetical protein
MREQPRTLPRCAQLSAEGALCTQLQVEGTLCTLLLVEGTLCTLLLNSTCSSNLARSAQLSVRQIKYFSTFQEVRSSLQAPQKGRAHHHVDVHPCLAHLRADLVGVRTSRVSDRS